MTKGGKAPVTESKNKQSWRQGLERVMQRDLPKPDYSLPAFNDPARMREFMNILGITQEDLAWEADVSRQLISQTENGRPFSEPSRTKIWNALLKLMEKQAKQNVENNPPDPNENIFGMVVRQASEMGLFKTPMELKDEEIELLKRERDLAREQRDTLKQVVDMNLLDRCVELEKQLADAHQQIADFHRLFALKGSAVAGDELQEQIEQRIKRSG